MFFWNAFQIGTTPIDKITKYGLTPWPLNNNPRQRKNLKMIQNKSNVPRCVNCANYEVTKQFEKKLFSFLTNLSRPFLPNFLNST